MPWLALLAFGHPADDRGCRGPFLLQRRDQVPRPLMRHCDQQAPGGLRVEQDRPLHVPHTLADGDELREVCLVAARPARHETLLDQGGHAVEHRDGPAPHLGGHPARAGHLLQVPDQAEAGHVGGCAGPHAPHGRAGPGIERRHHAGRLVSQLPAGPAPLDRRGDDPHGERLGEHQRHAGTGSRRPHDLVGVSRARDGHAVLGLGIVDGMAPHDRDPRLPRLVHPALEDAGEQVEVEPLRPADEVQREQGPAAHRVDVAQRVGCRDRSPVVRVVDDGGEEVHGLDERYPLGDQVHGGVVGRVEAEEQVGILAPRPFAEAAQDLRQVTRTELARSARPVRIPRQPPVRLLRHPPFIYRPREYDGSAGTRLAGRTGPVCALRRLGSLERIRR